jgi:NADP-dependent 3-hydroxy acid dehydrogenase YdfG
VKTAVVTGASRGIGKAIAAALAGAGIRTFMLARDIDELNRAAAELGNLAQPISCDVTDADAVAAVVLSITRATQGAPDILVNNAGLFPLSSLHEMQVNAFEQTLAINLVAPFRMTRAFLPAMRTRKSGHIITLGSVADRYVFPENGAYAASKHGQRAMHEVLRQEVQGTGVRASLISPAATDTSIWDAIDPDNRAGFPPRARMLRAESVANAVLWVVSSPDDMNVDELRLSRP